MYLYIYILKYIEKSGSFTKLSIEILGMGLRRHIDGGHGGISLIILLYSEHVLIL